MVLSCCTDGRAHEDDDVLPLVGGWSNTYRGQAHGFMCNDYASTQITALSLVYSSLCLVKYLTLDNAAFYVFSFDTKCNTNKMYACSLNNLHIEQVCVRNF